MTDAHSGKRKYHGGADPVPSAAAEAAAQSDGEDEHTTANSASPPSASIAALLVSHAYEVHFVTREDAFGDVTMWTEQYESLTRAHAHAQRSRMPYPSLSEGGDHDHSDDDRLTAWSLRRLSALTLDLRPYGARDGDAPDAAECG
jgi:hypothetical protein